MKIQCSYLIALVWLLVAGLLFAANNAPQNRALMSFDTEAGETLVELTEEEWPLNESQGFGGVSLVVDEECFACKLIFYSRFLLFSGAGFSGRDEWTVPLRN